MSELDLIRKAVEHAEAPAAMAIDPAERFIARLSGFLDDEDKELANRLFAVLPAFREVA